MVDNIDKYDYTDEAKLRLSCGVKKGRHIHLVLPFTLKDMGRLGYLKGEALEDYKKQEGR